MAKRVYKTVERAALEPRKPVRVIVTVKFLVLKIQTIMDSDY